MKRSLLIFLIMVLATLLLGEKVIINSNINSVDLISSDSNNTILELNIGSFSQTEVKIEGEIFSKISLEQEAETYQKGAPELPTLTRSIIIDNSYNPEFKIIDSEYSEYKISVAPSKGVITRDIDPETVPYTFGEEYQRNEFYPANITSLGSPYIMRNLRGVAVTFNPFQYNPKTQVLRVYTTLRVEITKGDKTGINTLIRSGKSVSSFEPLYQNHFLNYEVNRYAPLDEFGSILVIAPQNYISTMQIYANWKIQKGIPTEIVNVATIGNNANSIKSYIQNYYNSHPELAFVQIAGDAAQVASLRSGGGGADPMYALVAGSDNYPDIFIGRFSAENTDQLLTQVERTLNYERDLNTSATHLNKAMGIASAEGGSQGDNGETDIQHMNIIRNNLLNYNYTTVDQIHDPGASASAVASALNTGRGQINYIGHGSNTSWATSGFSNSYVNNLTNVGKLPFIVSVACVNGNFVNTTCFAEAWLRASHNGSPTGAMAIFASSINQSWASPMRGQDEIIQLLTQETLSTIGGLFYSGSCKMMDQYGTDGVNMSKTWHIFGDASLQLRTNTPQVMNVNHPGTLIAGSTSYNLNTGVVDALVAITYNNQILGSDYTDSSGNITLNLQNLPTTPVELTLTVTAFNRVTVVEPVTMSVVNGPYLTLADYSVNDSNNNGLLEYGETGSLNLTIENIGTLASGSGTITFSESDPYLTLTSTSASFTRINAGSSRNINSVINYSVSNDIHNDHSMTLSYIISASGEQYTGNLSLTGKSYIVEITNISINDSALGNGNSVIDMGETFEVVVTIENSGPAASPASSATIQNANFISYANNTKILPSIPVGSSREISFTATASNSIPVGQLVTFSVSSTYPNGIIEYSQGFLAALLQIGEGTEANTHLPMEPWYGYSYSQTIYQASELNLGATQIDKIAYQYNGNSAWTDAISIYMGNTTKDNFTSTTNWVLLPDLTEVYSGNFSTTATEGWIEIELTTPFIYDGTSNLVIGFDENTQGYHSNSDEFYCYRTPTNRSIYYYNDYTNPNPAYPPTGTLMSYSPNIRIFASAIATTPIMEVNTTSLDFGQVIVGNSATKTFNIKNSGVGILSGSIELPDNFSFDTRNSKKESLPTRTATQSFSLAAGASESYIVSYTATSTGSFSGNIAITSNDPDNMSVTIPLLVQVASPAHITVNAQEVSVFLEPELAESRTISITNSGGVDLNCSLSLQFPERRDMSEIFSANFNDHDLTNWDIEYLYSPSHTWHIENNLNGSSVNGTPFLFINSDAAGFNDLDDTIETSTFDVSNYSEITIEFDHFYKRYQTAVADVDFWTGSTWINLGRWQGSDTGSWTAPAHFSHTLINEGYSDVKLRFRYYNARYDWYWAIDDLVVSGEEVPEIQWVKLPRELNNITVASHSSEEFTLDFSAIDFALDNYSAVLNINSNAPNDSNLNIPISLTIGHEVLYLIAPNNVTVEVINNQANISWEAVPYADYYEVFYSADLISWTPVGQVNGTSYQHTQPRSEAAFYKIQAIKN